MAGCARWCETGCSDTVHLATSLVVERSTLSRSLGYKDARVVDEVACACAGFPLACSGNACPALHAPSRRAGQALRPVSRWDVGLQRTHPFRRFVRESPGSIRGVSICIPMTPTPETTTCRRAKRAGSPATILRASSATGVRHRTFCRTSAARLSCATLTGTIQEL